MFVGWMRHGCDPWAAVLYGPVDWIVADALAATFADDNDVERIVLPEGVVPDEKTHQWHA
jgi:hypothetical protein